VEKLRGGNSWGLELLGGLSVREDEKQREEEGLARKKKV
jgi:hypothetical protein